METNVLQAKKVLMVLLAVLMPLLTNAQTKVEFDGIWYNLVPKAKQAKVISSGDTKYTGLIIIPTTVTYEGVTYSVTSIGDGAFEGCSSLTFINIPESVTSIGSSAFRGCSSLTSINIPESVTSIGNTIFYECTGLTSITLPEGMTSIGYSTFNGCSSLTSITIPKSVTSIEGYAFSDCTSITSITIPEGVTKIGSYAFSDCTNLTSITLPEGMTSIGECAFFGCTSLTSITIPEGVTGIASRTFEACSSLASITLPEGVTNIVTGAFRGCSSLTTIVLPKSVRKIYSESLANCPELTDVYCHSENVPSTETNAFNGSWINYATLHVPASALNAYKTTAPWSNFGKFETLEITIDNITLNLSTATLAEGEELTLTATITPDDATDKSVSWTSSIPSVATVDNVGKVTAIAPGTATITAKANDGSGVSASCEVTVNELILGKCATPTISYVDGKVVLTCETEGAEVITTVTANNDNTFEALEFDYIPTQTFIAYATKEHYENSDPVSLTICWVPCTEKHEEDDADGILTIPAKPVLIQCQGGVITVSGLADGTEVAVYTTSGTLVSTATAEGDTTHLTAPTGQVYIVKVADAVVKIGM
ncbi:MAG: leucine-rich repeat protein [Bacteroidaceae bacterium]|nr:leucine-rich repeat protein [Bacteroidaceae bacterium]